MFNKFNLIAAILALLLFGYAQSQAWSMFENAAGSRVAGGGGGGYGGGSGGRIYHK